MKDNALLPVILAAVVPLLLFTLIILGTSVQWIAWRPPLLWTEHLGTTSDSPPTISGTTAVVVDKADLYLGGFINLTGSTGDAFLSRHDLGGREMWIRTVSSNMSSELVYPASPISKIALLSQNIYVAANINDSSVILNYDSSGNRIWVSRFGGYSEIDGISASATGVYVIGDTFSVAASGLVQEYDFSGKLVWNTTISRPGALVDLSAGQLGIYVLTTSSISKYDQAGNLVWTRPVNCDGCTPDSSLSQKTVPESMLQT